MGEKKSDVEEAVEELLTDPDAPEKGNTNPPQTIDGEPADPKAEKGD